MNKENWYYKDGFRFTHIEGAVEVTGEERDRLLSGADVGLIIASNSEGYPILTNPYTGEEYTGDWRDFDITQEAEHIEMMRVQGIQELMLEITQELTSMDYLDMKEADGEDMTKYGDWRATRRALRARHRELESQI